MGLVTDEFKTRSVQNQVGLKSVSSVADINKSELSGVIDDADVVEIGKVCYAGVIDTSKVGPPVPLTPVSFASLTFLTQVMFALPARWHR